MRDGVIVAFAISHACPLKCDFCCSTKETVGGGRIRRDMIERCMRDFGSHPSVDRFSFSGGDPFLYLREIEAGVAASRAHGVLQPFQIVTSGYWVKERSQTHETLARLQSLGMDTICLSYDYEHAKWVSAEQIMTACQVAGELGMKVSLIGTFWSKDENLVDLLPDVMEMDAVKRIYQFLTLPEGRARTSRQWPQHQHLRDEDKYSCGRIGIYDCVIYPDGNVYPCCPGGIQIEAKLSGGNVNTEDAATILGRIFTNFHVRFVKEFGWGVLYDVIAREAPDLLGELPQFKDVSSACEICRDLNVNLADRLAPIYEKIERHYVQTRAELEWNAEPSAAPRWFGGDEVTLPEMLDLLATSREARHDFLSGARQLTASKTAAVSALV